MQGKHFKSKGLKRKIVAPVLAATLLTSAAIPAVSSWQNAATAASVDENAVGLASNEYNAPVNADNDDNEGLYWANATYFDYLSDAEISSGWLNTLKAGTGFNGSVDEWYPYYQFNREVVKSVADANTGWATPLYFGNFCNTWDAYQQSNHHVGLTGKTGYDDATDRQYNIAANQSFNYAANNSNGLSNYNESYQGLMRSTLDLNGNLMTPNGTIAPYFNKDLLTNAKKDYAKIVNSKFPFTQQVKTLANGMEYTYYEFNSENAEDNVYFTWNGNTPTAVNYGAGTDYGVLDGIRYFMNPADTDPATGKKYASGYGIFPFNNRSNQGSSSTSTGTRYIYLGDVKNGWGDVYCYFFNGSQTVGAAWPGTKMTTYDGTSNRRIAIPDGATSLIFNNGGSGQTGDITDISFGAYWIDASTNVNQWGEAPADAGTGVSADAAANENLDYGFGIKTSMKFRVPKYGTLDGTVNGSPVTFEYSGDDDLWVYITDLTAQEAARKEGNTTGNFSQLVLDLGGNHKQSEGTINFKTLKATASKVYNGQTDVVKSFHYDYTHTYEMTVFYMERGMLESNCKIAFTMVPLGNDFTVTEKINTTYINPGLQTTVAALDRFTFQPFAGENGATAVSGLNYIGEGIPQVMSGNTFTLGSNGAANFSNVFTTGNKIAVKQTQATSSYLTYDSGWTFYDNVGNQAVSSGYQATVGSGNSTDKKTLINSTNPSLRDTYEFASLQADFENTPQSAPVSVSKFVYDPNAQSIGDVISDGSGIGGSYEFDETEFGATVTVQLREGEPFKPYQLTYTADDMPGQTFTTSATGQLAAGAKLRDGRTLTFEGIPVGARFRVIEDDIPSGYTFYSIEGVDDSSDTNGGWVTVPAVDEPELDPGAWITISNTPPKPESGTGELVVFKTVDGEYYDGNLFTYIAEPRTVSAANAGGRTFITKNSQQKIITSKAEDGVVTFNLTFNEAGWYRYRIFEDTDKLFLDGLDNQGYTGDVTSGGTSTKYYAEFEVVANADRQLVINGTPKYYSDSNCTTEIDNITIKNTVKPAKINILKQDQEQNPLNETQFMVVKVKEEIAAADYDTQVNAMLKKIHGAFEDVSWFLGTTLDDGTLEFNDLPIYQNGDKVFDLANNKWITTENSAGGTLVPQTYMVFEYSPKNGYNTNKTLKFVTFPYDGNNFEITFDDYLNVAVINPASGGFQSFVTVGACILGGSLLLAGAYVLMSKKKRAKSRVRTQRRFK